ncbi:MAG: anthranilate phosphoribosyltransferase, partial [Synechococcus sp.]
LRGGDCAVNQQILQNVLQGQGSLAQTEVVAFNTALVLWAAGLQSDLPAAVAQALAVLNEGKAWDKLVALRDALSDGDGE